MSRHLCSKELYTAFLQASSIRYSSTALSDVSPIDISHDSISNWIKSKNFQPKEIWHEVKNYIKDKNKGVLIVDDTILDKHRSKKIELVRYQYSGNAHDIIPGIGMTNLLWHSDEQNLNLPVDFRIYAPQEDGKTKNDHFKEMLKLAKQRGLSPEAVIADCWYSSLTNLKMIKDMGWFWIMGLKKNRKVNRNQELKNLEIPDEGLKVYLRGYGWILVFRFTRKNGRIEYIGTNIENITKTNIKLFTKMRWNIEIYHRELKQTCGIERCQARTSRAQRNHILLCVKAWINHFKRCWGKNVSFYQIKWDVIKPAISLNLQYLLPTI